MAYTFGYKLTDYTIKIVDFLYIYRGMTALQLAEMMYPSGYTESQEKSVYNHLRKLKKQGLLESLKLQQNVNPGSLYFLTMKGIGVAKESLNVIPGHYGHGFLKKHFDGDRSAFGDLPYDVYKPPLKQIAHHLMSIDFYIQLKGLSGVDHRIGLYAKQTFNPPLPITELTSVIRPDAEIHIENIGGYFVEFDRATEGHEQLRGKFNRYAEYFDYLKDQEKPLPSGILFVVESKRATYGMDRRWENVLSAFLREMRSYHEEVNLIMLTMDQVKETILFESTRKVDAAPQANLYTRLRTEHSLDVKGWKYKGEPIFCIASQEDEYQVIFISCVQTRESMVYSKLAHFLNHLPQIKLKDEVRNMTFTHWRGVLLHQGAEPVVVKGLEKHDVPEQLKAALQTIKEELLSPFQIQ